MTRGSTSARRSTSRSSRGSGRWSRPGSRWRSRRARGPRAAEERARLQAGPHARERPGPDRCRYRGEVTCAVVNLDPDEAVHDPPGGPDRTARDRGDPARATRLGRGAAALDPRRGWVRLDRDAVSRLGLKPSRPGRLDSNGNADVAQLVEHHLAKVGVAGSNPVVRSTPDLQNGGPGRRGRGVCHGGEP